MKTKTLVLAAGLALSTTAIALTTERGIDGETGFTRTGFYTVQLFIWDENHKGGGYSSGGALMPVLMFYPEGKRKTVMFDKRRYDNAEDCMENLWSNGGIACAKVETSYRNPPLNDPNKKGRFPYYVLTDKKVIYFIDDLGQKHKFLDTLKTSNYR